MDISNLPSLDLPAQHSTVKSSAAQRSAAQHSTAAELKAETKANLKTRLELGSDFLRVQLLRVARSSAVFAILCVTNAA